MVINFLEIVIYKSSLKQVRLFFGPSSSLWWEICVFVTFACMRLFQSVREYLFGPDSCVCVRYVAFCVFRCVLASLYEAVTVHPLVRLSVRLLVRPLVTPL